MGWLQAILGVLGALKGMKGEQKPLGLSAPNIQGTQPSFAATQQRTPDLSGFAKLLEKR